MASDNPVAEPAGALRFRAAAAVLGAAAVVIAWIWIRHILSSAPLFAYGHEWFLRLGPAEPLFLLALAAAGGSGAVLLARAGTPLFRRRGGKIPLPPGIALLVLGALASLASILIARLLLQGQVLTDDEYVYLFQSRLLAAGHAAGTAPPPPLDRFVENVFVVVQDGRWFGQYPPGHPLALLPGVLLGIPRLVPVLLAGVNVVLTGLCVKEIAGPRAAVLGAALLALSPLYLLTGATLLSHGTAYAALALASWGALRTLRGSAAWGLAAGAGLGFLLLVRPYTAVTLGLFPAAILLTAAMRAGSARPLLAAALPVLAAVAGFLAYNRAATGDPFLTGYEAIRRVQGTIELGFGPIVPGGALVHTPLQGLRNAGILALRLHLWALGWPLLLPVLLLALRGEPGRLRTAARAALAMLVVGLLSYIPYWSVGVNDTGPVKTFELLLPTVVLVVLGLRAAAVRWGTPPVAAFATASFLAAAVLFWPTELRHLRRVSSAVAEPLARVRSEVELPALVFVTNMQPPEARSWVFGRPDPRPDLGDPILYVRDLGAANRDFWLAHRERTPYRLQYDRAGRLRLQPLTERR